MSRPATSTVRATRGLVTTIARGMIEPLEGGERSLVTIALTFEGHGIGKALLPLILRQARKQLPPNTQKLKEVLDPCQKSCEEVRRGNHRQVGRVPANPLLRVLARHRERSRRVGIGGDLLRTDYVRDIFERLEYPEYLLTIPGVPKLVAAVVLVVPGVPRMKEWAHAGAMFTYVGAVASHVAVDDAATALVTPSVYAVLTAVSWALRPPSRRDFTSSRPSGTDSCSTSMTLSRSSSR
jgi:hypothetical protein